MTNDDMRIVGRQVKDMYGALVGKVIGAMTDIDGTIQTVGVDCSSQGLKQIPFDQLVAQGDIVIFIPKWRLESQRLLREKGLTLRRLRALVEIVSENDEMREDAEIVNEKYRSQLAAFERRERDIGSTLEERQAELDEQLKAVKLLVFDAKVQFKSEEIPDRTFQAVKAQAAGLMEHVTHEGAEISNVQRRIADLNMEVKQVLDTAPKHLQDSAVTYLGTQPAGAAAKLPEAPTQAPIPEPPRTEAPIPEPPQAPIPEPPQAPIPEPPQAPIPEPPQAPIPEPPHTEAPIPEPPHTEAPIPEPPQQRQQPKPDWLARMEAQ